MADNYMFFISEKGPGFKVTSTDAKLDLAVISIALGITVSERMKVIKPSVSLI